MLDKQEIGRRAVESAKLSVAAGSEAIKLCTTFNAGALIALLGFLGAAAGKGVIDRIDLFLEPMRLFGLGLILSGSAFASIYFAQTFFTTRLHHMENGRPFATFTWLGNIFRFGAIAMALTAFGCFVIGCSQAIELLRNVRLGVH